MPKSQPLWTPDKLGRKIDLSCPDWAERIRHGASLMPFGLPLDLERASRARSVFDMLKLPDVKGTPTFGDVGGEWFKEIVGAVFGTWNGDERIVNEFFILVPKKNSKTTNSAGIMVTALLLSERPNAEFLLVAPTQQVAGVAFEQAVGMIEADPTLKLACQIKDYQRKIICRHNGATLKVKSFDPTVLTGTKPAGVLLDELHVIAEHHNADRVIGQLRGGLISQPEAFMITITTQSERPPSGVFRTELMKARKVRDGSARLKLLPILYEFPTEMIRDDSWRDSSNWWMVTPNRDRSITIDRLREDYENAKTASEEELRRWASQHLNIEVGMALASDHWVGASFWLAAQRGHTLEEVLSRAEVVTVGIDGGGLDDMLALSVCGRDKKTKKWLMWTRAWIHNIAIERRKIHEQQYRDFEKDGDLVIVEAIGQDVTEIGELVAKIRKSGKFNAVGIDQSAIGGIVDELVARGIDPKTQIIGIPQGWRLTSAIKTMERKLAEGSIEVANQRLTSWSAENARIEPRGNAILITKALSGFGKIDPLMAQLNAVELMSRNPEAGKDYAKSLMFVGGGTRQ